MDVVYTFAQLRLDARERRLEDERGGIVPLPARAFDALALLARNAGELIEKETLMSVLWPNVSVAENTLDQVMSTLRRTLKAHGVRETVISTERGRGYRFVGRLRVYAPAHLPSTPAVSSQEEASSGNAEARQLYSQARTLSVRPGPENLRAASELLQACMVLDPGFLLAAAHLAMLRTVLVAFDLASHDELANAEREARELLAASPGLARAHQALGNVCTARGLWNEAAHHYAEATRLELQADARITRIWHLRHSVGHLRQARREAIAVRRCAPFQTLGMIAAASASLLLDRNAQARRHADRARGFGWPLSNPALQDLYVQLALRQGRFAEAAALMVAGLTDVQRAAGAVGAVEQLCGWLAGTLPRRTALAAVRALARSASPAQFGMVGRRRILLWLTMLGALDDAFTWVNASLDHSDRAATIGFGWGIIWTREMAPLRRDCRFHALVTRLRLMEYWVHHGPPDGYRIEDGLLVCTRDVPSSG